MDKKVIQGGMGMGVSTYRLARAVSTHNGLGTISGVAIGVLMARTLQSGDPGGHYRRALAQFPYPAMTEKVLAAYFVEGGIAPGRPYKSVPPFSFHPPEILIALTICANFAQVYLAKEGHDNPVAINYLEKIQLPHIFSFFGAMLAEVDWITMGAGLAFQVPAILDALAAGRPVHYNVDMDGGESATKAIAFDPRKFLGATLPALKRPNFSAIISVDGLAKIFQRKEPGGVQAFIVENPSAGGHNARPRDSKLIDPEGQPIYNAKDCPNWETMRGLGLPFWIGGSCASPASLAEAEELGAAGIQAGTIFALSNESGLRETFKRTERRRGYRGELEIRSDPAASPTGFVFKVAQIPGTLSEAAVYRARHRICNHRYLATPCEGEDGQIDWRCKAEPIEAYIRKGGKAEDTDGDKCLCNGLLSGTDYGDPEEPAILTLGSDTSFLPKLMKDENDCYSAAQAMAYLLSGE